jgi:protein TonB
MAPAQSRLRYLPLVTAVVTIIGLIAGLFFLVRNWMDSAPVASKPVAQEIRIIRPPPPPPKVEEPPQVEEKVDVPEPEPEPQPSDSDEAPPGDQLGLDSEGVAGADGFGLAARKGGRDLLGSGGSTYQWYANVIKSEILDVLSQDDRIRRGAYSVPLSVWISADGEIVRFLLRQSTGDSERDRAIEARLRNFKSSKAPPEGMPLPVTFRLATRA